MLFIFLKLIIYMFKGKIKDFSDLVIFSLFSYFIYMKKKNLIFLKNIFL